MKARILVLLLCCLAFPLASCGGDDDSDSANNDGGKAASEEKVELSFVLAALDNAFYVAEKEGIEAEAAKHPNVDISVTAGRKRTAFDQVVSLLEDATVQQPDAIAVDGSDTKPLIPALKRVIEADIPLILFDAPAEELKGQYKAFIGTDNFDGGKVAGEWLKGALPEGGDVALILCVAGHPVTNARVDGFKEGAGPGFEYVSELDAECDREKARKVMEDILASHPDVDAVFSTSDTQTMGAIKAVKASGKDPKMISFDAQPEAVKAIIAGDIDATAGWSARALGAAAFNAALAAAQGKPVKDDQLIPTTIVDETNASTWEG
jgi:ribose transport system substrate-binding protein